MYLYVYIWITKCLERMRSNDRKIFDKSRMAQCLMYFFLVKFGQRSVRIADVMCQKCWIVVSATPGSHQDGRWASLAQVITGQFRHFVRWPRQIAGTSEYRPVVSDFHDARDQQQHFQRDQVVNVIGPIVGRLAQPRLRQLVHVLRHIFAGNILVVGEMAAPCDQPNLRMKNDTFGYRYFGLRSERGMPTLSVFAELQSQYSLLPSR